ncbi:nucleolar protein 9 isoform X2 [Microcaecilia unicolor]|uniref:Nucleolar protein 9 isoform X2 n=1 Tax=Microcaecilia unicolor TaxID=1415580 RepID=A0A6P7WPN1_9AMPH|nr:nucleolar protein 9 isoform X2 [Microcaecilia unicolor]
MGIKKKSEEDKRKKKKKRQSLEACKGKKGKKGREAAFHGTVKTLSLEPGSSEQIVGDEIPSSKGPRKAGNPCKGLKQKETRDSDKKQQPKLDPKTVGYFRRVHETLQQDFDSEQEKRLFLRNVLEEVKGIEFAVATDTLGSVVLQRLLELASPPQALRLLFALCNHFFQVSCHRSGAHVIQTALLQYPRLQEQEQGQQAASAEEGAEEEAAGKLEDIVLQLCTDVKDKFLMYNENTHGSFVVRSLFQVLGGIVQQESAKKGSRGHTVGGRKANPGSNPLIEFEVPESFPEQLKELASCFQENIAGFVTGKTASLALQVALQVLRKKLPLVCAELCDAIVSFLSSRNPSADYSSLLVFLKDQTSSRVLEEVLLVLDGKRLKRLFHSHFKGHLLELSAHPIANFTIQRLLAAIPSKKLFATVFDELSPGLEDVLAKGHMGVITELIAACRRHSCRQKEGLARLMEAFHCAVPASRRITCSFLFLSLLTYEIYFGKDDSECATEHQESERPLQDVNYHGSLLMQHLLHFCDPAPVLLSLAAMTSADLMTLACSKAGSHVFDALLTSSSISEKQWKKVLRKLKGHYVQLACSKSGSRVLDRVWNVATLAMKQEMAEELAERERELHGDPFGHHIVRNFALTHFLKRRGDWEEHQLTENKRRRLFAELLED